MSRNSRCFLLAGTIALTIALAGSVSKAQDTKTETATGTISGRVLDANGKGVANAAVFVCEQESGMPVGNKKRNVMTFKRLYNEGERPLWVKTNDSGQFEISDLLAGKYRVFAQKWESDFEDALEVNGIVVDLLGSADNLKVPSDESQAVTLQRAGTGVIQFPGAIANNDAFVFLSTEYPGDAALGLLGWQAPFGNHVIGVNRMTMGKTTFRGFPNGKVGYTEIELDNLPGVYAGRGKITPDNQKFTGKSAEEDMIAGWSNARYTPEKELLPVFNHVKKLVNDGRIGEIWTAVSRGTGAAGKLEVTEPGVLFEYKNFSLLQKLGPLERKIELPDYGEATVNETLASLNYLEIERMFLDRIAKRKQQQESGSTPKDDLPQKKK